MSSKYTLLFAHATVFLLKRERNTMQIIPYCRENRIFKFEIQWGNCKLQIWRARQIPRVHNFRENFRENFPSDTLETFTCANTVVLPNQN